MPNGTMGTTPEGTSLGLLMERLTKMHPEYLDFVKAAIDVIENDAHDDGETTPGEWMAFQVLSDYAWSRLTPESVEADLEHFTQCVKDLKDEPEPTTPEEIGEKIRGDLRNRLRARLRREFQDWAKEASEPKEQQALKRLLSGTIERNRGKDAHALPMFAMMNEISRRLEDGQSVEQVVRETGFPELVVANSAELKRLTQEHGSK